MDELTARLSERMSSPLPGLSAQLKMASGLRRKAASSYKVDESNAKISAVLIALYADNGVIRTVLMKRPDYDGTHSGQVSFPGGKLEETDNGIVEAALREAEEEVNIKPNDEVESIHTPELSYLFREDIIDEIEILLTTGFKLKTPSFKVDGHTVWGATAMMIAELREVFENISLER